MSERRLLGVAGRPIGHSLSPLIFRTLFREMGIDGLYIRLAAADASDALALAEAIGLAGLNVTSPFKEDMTGLLSEQGGTAARIGAVNCLVMRDGVFRGCNTDPAGAVGALEQSGIRVRDIRAVVLGAGGAARAAAFGLLRGGAAEVVLVNRTPEKGAAAAARIGCRFAPLQDLARILPGCDLLVSAIPSGAEHLPDLGRRRPLVVLDADYRNSSFVRAGGAAGYRVIDGRAWLLRQALLSFALFTGRHAPRFLRGQLRAALRSAGEPPKKHLALIGFMGAGKTTIGRILADRLGRPFVDTDSAIEASAGRTIAGLFRTEGEPAFRIREAAAIREAVAAERPSILSIGGGGVLDADNVRSLRQACRLAWLWVSPALVPDRVSASHRPRLGPSPSPVETAALLAQRLPHYAEACDFVVNTDAAAPLVAAGRIIDEMR